MVDGGNHVVTLKGHKIENGNWKNMWKKKLMLNIRDSAKEPNNTSEIWIERNNTSTNVMNLAADMCVYFELQ